MKAGLNVFLVIFLFSMITEESSGHVQTAGAREAPGNKITIVGAGHVGMAVAVSLLTQLLIHYGQDISNTRFYRTGKHGGGNTSALLRLKFVTDEIVLIDIKEREQVLNGEVKDLQDGTVFIKSPKIQGGTDYTLSKNSRICIITAGFNQKTDQERDELVHKNFEIFKDIIPQLITHNPNAVFLIVTNPVDVMTYITWKLVNEKNNIKVIGSGTNLDTARLRFLISQDLQISPESVDGWVVGGHGEHSVTVWSGMNVAGVNLRDIKKDFSSKVGEDENIEKWFDAIHKKMVDSAKDIINLKGKTSWAVGLSVANIAYSIIHNIPNIHAVSTMVKGYHGINDEMFMSLPCVLGENGVTRIINQPLEKEEKEKLHMSAAKILKVMNSLDWKVKN